MTEQIQIGNRWVGPGQPTFIVAEVGSNHSRDKDRARQLIDIVAACGADAVKFQLFRAEDLYPKGIEVFELVKLIEFPVEWLSELAGYAADRDLIFLASAFSHNAVDLLTAVSVPAIKIASSETVNLPLLKYAAAAQLPILLSTGMCDLADVYEAVEVIRSEGNHRILLFQCTSLYPTEPEHVHLRVMDTLRAVFDLPVGFSDHTMSTVIPAVAVARGACVIEKHITLDRTLEGPDHIYALEPAEFKSMIQGIRETEKALGSAMKIMLPEETRLARRESVRAACDISPGERIRIEDLSVARPAGGIRPRYLPAVIGMNVRKELTNGDVVTWDNLDFRREN